jgi:hypothetical protein
MEAAFPYCGSGRSDIVLILLLNNKLVSLHTKHFDIKSLRCIEVIKILICDNA